MDKLTTFERALLAQFEPLAAASEQALKGLETVSRRLELLSSATEKRFKDMAERERRLAQALDEQTKLTEAWRAQSESLVQQVNALLRELRRGCRNVRLGSGPRGTGPATEATITGCRWVDYSA